MGHENGGWMNDEQREATKWEALFPIMGDRVAERRGYMPMAIMKEHEQQAERNHSQTILRLKERGGLSPSEAMAVIRGERYYDLWWVNDKTRDEDAIWSELQGIAKVRFPDFDPATGEIR